LPEPSTKRPAGRPTGRSSAPPARGGQTISTRDALRLRGLTRRQLSRHERSVRQRRYILIGGSSLLVAILLIVGIGALREYVLRGQETVATIFGERVSANDLVEATKPQLYLLDRRIALYRANNMTQQAAQFQLQRDRQPETTLTDLVQNRVIARAAAERGITVGPDEVDNKLRQQVADSDNLTQPQPTPTEAPTAAADAAPTATPVGTATPRPTATAVPTLTGDRYGPALQDYLNNTGQTEPRLRSNIQSDLYQQKVREAIGQEVPAVQEQIHARHIVFSSEDDANAGLQQLQGGAAWETLAANSTDKATKDKGGDLGWLPRLGRDLSFDDAAFALQPGETSPVVQTSRGSELIQVVERDQARPLADNQLDELRRRRFQDWLNTATGDPAINRQLTPEQSAWVLQKAASGRRV
jgi:parvulin-like peptidyl-prolyl isomerase